MRFTARQYAETLHAAISETTPQDKDKILDNFVTVLKEQRAFSMIDDIEREYLRLHGIRTGQVTSANALSKQDENDIVEKLNAYVGGQVELKKKIDQGLIGGIVVRVDDELIDGSIKHNLDNLKKALTK